MRKFIILFAVIGIGSLLLGYTVMADEKELVKVPLDNYLQGQSTGNPEFMRKAFHADARIMAFRDGKVMSLSVDGSTENRQRTKLNENAGSKASMFREMPRQPKSFSITRM